MHGGSHAENDAGMPGLKAYRGLFIGLVLSGAVALPAIFSSRPLLIYNATESLPQGLYLVVPEAEYQRGELVAFPVPPSVREMVRERRWLPDGALLIKPVSGKAGDVLDTENGRCMLNGEAFGSVHAVDRRGEALPIYSASRPLENGEIVLLSHACGSFDSRYFGPIREQAVIGAARPIWTWERTTREAHGCGSKREPGSTGEEGNGVERGSAR